MKNYTTNKNWIFSLVLALMMTVIVSVSSFAQSIYYYEDFSGTQTSLETDGWDFNFAMNRFYIIDNTSNVTAGDGLQFWVSNQPANNRLYFFGDPNADREWDQWFTGKGALLRMLSNSQLGAIDATPENPFGFEVIRYYGYVHRDLTPFTPDWVGNNDDDYGKGLMEVWLVEDNGAINQGDSFDNYVFWYDKAYNHDNFNNRSNNVWGLFDQYERDNNDNGAWPAFTDVDGNIMSSTLMNNTHRKQYSYANFAATNELGIKMVHDGSTVTIYLNLDPLNDSPGLFDSWVEFATANVAWNQNLGVYFAAESPTPDGQTTPNRYTDTEAQFGDFTVRSVISNLTASITPKKVKVNTNVTFTVTIDAGNIAVNDSGMGEIYIEAPADYGAFDVNSVAVSHPVQGALTRTTVAAKGYGTLTASEFYSGTRNGMLYIRFNMGGTDAANHIITSGTLTVSFDVTTGPTANSTGSDFGIYADCVKHAGTGQDIILGGTIKYATTGKKKAYPSSTGELTVKSFDNPQAYADVQYTPQPLIMGNDEADFTIRLSTVGLFDNPEISKMRIEIPTGFVVSNNSVDYPVVSSVLGPFDSTNNIFVASNFIYVFYTNINGFPGSEGYDRVQFTVWDTPTSLGTNAYTNFQWKVDVNSEELIAGTIWQAAGTNSIHKSQDVTVAKSNAITLAYVVTKTAPNINAKTGIFTNVAWNTNNYKYVIYNNGDVSNNVKQLRISIPAAFDQITAVSSSNGGTNYVSGGFIYVDYTNDLESGEQDIISFTGRHTLIDINSSPSNVAFELYADNWNTSGYTLQSQDAPRNWFVTISPPIPSAENNLSPAILYTTDVTNSFNMDLYNTSPNGVGLGLVRIDIPTNYFNSISAISSYLNDSVANIEYTNLVSSTNTILVHYNADANGDLPSYYDSGSGDLITISLIDDIQYNSFAIMPTNFSFPVFVYKTSYMTNDTNFYAISTIGERFPGTNEIYVQYPEVEAAYYITNVQNNALDTTSITNTLVYFITNTGQSGNRITNAYINIPTDVSVDFWVDNITTGNAVVQTSNPYNRLWINFPTPLEGGEQTVLTFTMVDIVDAKDKANIYLYPDIENNRELVAGLTNVVSGQSGKIDFSLPKPTGGGSVSPNVFFVTKNEPVSSVVTQAFTLVFTNTGIGTDLFNAVQLDVPDPLQGMVVNIASSRLGTDLLSTPAYFNNNLSNLQVIYSNAGDPVLTTEGDTLTVTVHISNVNSLPTNGAWEFLANNGFIDNGFAPPKRFFALTNVDMGSKLVYGTERVSVNIISDTLTTEITNTFDYVIKNGGAGNLTVDKVRIKIPQPPYVSVDPAQIFISGVSADVSVSGGYIWITNFSGGGLAGGGQSTLSIQALKNILLDSTNVEWVAEVYYTNDSTGVALATKGTNSEEIQLPPPEFYAYVDETQIGKDNITTDIQLSITNVGAAGNRISLLRIVPPTTNELQPLLIVTNIDNLVSTLGATVWYSNDGMLYADYAVAGTNIAGGVGTDVISMRVFDNQDNIGFNGEWNVYAASKSGDEITNATKDPIDIGESLAFNLIVPAYATSYYISPNEVSTVSVNNDISVYLNNTGGGANNLITARITFAEPFVTNNIAVSTGIGTGFTVGSNYIEVTYNDGDFAPSSNDVVVISLDDNFNFGETNAQITVKAQYSTSGSTFVDASVVFGENNTVDFVMPSPDVLAEILDNDIYTSQDNVRLTLRFINRGTGSNALQKVRLFVPQPFTDGMTTGSVTDGLATNVTMVSNELTLYYDSFTPDVTNTIVLDLTNTQKTKTELYFESYAFNGLKETNTVGVLDSKTNHIVSPLSAEIVDQQLWSSDLNNTINLKIYNDSDGTASIYYAKVNVPSIFTNVVSISSSSGTVVSNSISNIVINYPAGLIAGAEDTINLVLEDDKDMFETTGLSWQVLVDNNTGYGEVLSYVPGALDQYMSIPLSEVSNNILTKWFLIKTGNEVPTNTFVVVVTNISAGNNLVSSNVIILPDQLTNILLPTLIASFPGSDISLSGNMLTVEYTNSGQFGYGETNQISFQFENRQTSQSSVNLEVYAYNGSSEGSDGGALKESVTINFNAPQEPTEAYVQNKQVLYSIDNDAEIVYLLNNGLFDLGIDKVKIAFSNEINVTNIYSELFAQDLAFTTDASYIYIDYTALGGIPNKLDSSGGREILHIYTTYTNVSSWTNDMSSGVMFEDTIEYVATKKPNGENDFVPVLLADFGRISGIVLPGSANPTARLYYQGTTIEVTNKFTNLIISGADVNGNFTLDFIPGLNGKVYDISFTGENYVETMLTNVLVSNNIVTSPGTVKMIRDLFSLSATSSQESLSLDDLQTKVVVPTGVVKERFSLNIWITNMESDQQTATSGGFIKTPNDVATVDMYWFEMKDFNGNELKEVELDGDVYVTLHYDSTNIAAQGWDENKLAVYYWREISGEWIRLGGTVDTANDTVVIRTSYLRKHYAILGEAGASGEREGFIQVVAEPKIFTPGSSDNAFANVKITVSFDSVIDSYNIKIYTLAGILVKEYNRTEGSYSQGEVYWDGNDSEGYAVNSGVYIYRIVTAEGNDFTGTIVVAK